MAREPTNAEKLVYGADVQIDEASGAPIETGRGALPCDRQPQIVRGRQIVAAQKRVAADKAAAAAAQAKVEQDTAAAAALQN